MDATEHEGFSVKALTEVRTILAPINGSEASLASLRLACELAHNNKGRVYAVYVIEVSRNLPLEAELPEEVDRSEQIFAEAQLAMKGYASLVEFELLQARNAATTIVDEAINSQAGAIILGVSDKRHRGEYLVGSTAEFVLRHAPCQVWLCRSPLSPAVPSA